MIERQAERAAEHAEARARRNEPVLPPEERERLAQIAQRRKSLELSIANLNEQLRNSTSERFREHLQRSIAAAEVELGQLES